MRRLATVAVALLAACTSSASGGGGSGNVQIFVVPEDSITNGLEPGTGAENVQDGWTISYDRYLVSVGSFRARRTDTGDTLSDPSRYVLDLKAAPTSGYVTTELRDVDAVRWDKFGYDIPNASAGARPLPPTTQADADFMIANGYSVYYEGRGVKGDVTISFAWGFAAGTSFDDCASPDGVPGFAVPAGGTVQVKPTLHGDHQYFDNVTQGVEITQRLAQWLEICDADRDRTLTLDELKRCDVVTALPQPPYDLTQVKDEDGSGKLSVYDYVLGQMRTFGDYQGDGECATRSKAP
ncbi:MAG: putative lipoprotein [Labilithrix sp.]|nr:putative lipoprotein [Labilithrix sp.]